MSTKTIGLGGLYHSLDTTELQENVAERKKGGNGRVQVHVFNYYRRLRLHNVRSPAKFYHTIASTLSGALIVKNYSASIHPQIIPYPPHSSCRTEIVNPPLVPYETHPSSSSLPYNPSIGILKSTLEKPNKYFMKYSLQAFQKQSGSG